MEFEATMGTLSKSAKPRRESSSKRKDMTRWRESRLRRLKVEKNLGRATERQEARIDQLECPECCGRGVIYWASITSGEPRNALCSRCHGTGLKL